MVFFCHTKSNTNQRGVNMTLDYKQLKRDFIAKQQQLDKLQAQQRVKQAQQKVRIERLKNK